MRPGAVLRLAIATLVLVGALFVFVFPTSALLDQRSQLAGAEQRLAVLRRQTARLAKRSDRLRTDAEVQRIARDRYNMVRPGEQAWAVLPGPTPLTPVPPTPAPSPTSGSTAPGASPTTGTTPVTP